MKKSLKYITVYYGKFGKRIGVIFTAILLMLLVSALFASHGAAFIFNRVMETQSVVKGTIHVNTLSADIRGQVNFTDLEWDAPDGTPVLLVPSGSFKVNPWDFILHRSLKTTTLREITLNDSTVSIKFNKDMSAQIISSEAPESVKKSATLDEKIRTLNMADKKFNLRINLNNCRFEAYKDDKQYVMTSVDAALHLKSNEFLTVNFSSGPFSGTAVGDGINIDGSVNLRTPIPEADLEVNFLKVDPSSVGFGKSVHDPLTLKTQFTGPVSAPMAHGKLEMDKLSIPALDFTNVRGYIDYKDGIFLFTNVTADVYNGKLAAYGDYNLNTRAYTIHGKGTGLDSRIALKRMEFKCLVDTDITMECDGNPDNLLTYGSFRSGKGRYTLFSFNYLEGKFSNRRHLLEFFDVAIATKFGLITTDAFQIVNGKLILGNISVVFPSSSVAFNLFSSDSNAPMSWSDIRENLSVTKNNMKELKNGTSNFRDTSSSMKENMRAIKENMKKLKTDTAKIKQSLKPSL